MMRSGKPAKPVSYLKVRFEKDQEIFVILQMIAQSKAAFVKKAFSGIRKTIKEMKVD